MQKILSGMLAAMLAGPAFADEMGTPDEAKAMIALAKESGEGWVDYRWPHPGSDEIRAKTSDIATNDEGFLCGVGAYK